MNFGNYFPVVNVQEGNTPLQFSLEQNYPNLFNPVTTIIFSLKTTGNVTLKIFDVRGSEVATLYNNEKMESGKYRTTFNGTTFPSGVYYYRLQVDEQFIESKKFVLMK
jgi:hypothetical protein